MKLLIISHTEHYCAADAARTVVGWEPTVREIDALARVFETVTHIAPLHNIPAPPSASPYQAGNVIFSPVKPAGGARLADKLAILTRLPTYAGAILRALPTADVVHVRCPANISLIALVLLMLVRRPRLRWIKYAGDWQPEPQSARREPRSYRLQRWLLQRNLPRGVVTINGRWSDQPPHVITFFNPCLTDEELADARQQAESRSLSQPLKLIYVGSLTTAKGVGRALIILAEVQRQGVTATLDLVGDGGLRGQLEEQARQLGVAGGVTFHGWLPRTDLNPLYARSHILVLPSVTEGWPKVISEAMAYGVVPVASAVGSIAQSLHDFGTGRALPPDDERAFAEAIVWYTRRPDDWRQESRDAMKAAALFTYTHYLTAVGELVGIG